ncbi:hypothetical protein TKK_0012435 [Trichogramma kaykai]|uniref:PiggyBac transposable element-derived protein domain-containing protein n=1 Tax=Trichogramma kaykai TaxID=54128 RepID=A0ABD2WNT7_9HYME
MLEPLLSETSHRKLGKYHVYIDNLFCSADLLIHLEKCGLKATGTLRKDRCPEKISFDKKAERGTFQSKYDKKSGTNFITLKDSKDISVLSTAAGVTPLMPVERYCKDQKEKCDIPFPYAFVPYNQFMGGVDTHDQHCNKRLPCVRSKKWTWVIFMLLIQAAITNATVLCNICNESKKKTGTKVAALSISRDYLYGSNKYPKKEKKTVKHKKIAQTTIKFCSNKCGVRTLNICSAYKLYFCKKCFAQKH